jgi:hypothetical protein
MLKRRKQGREVLEESMKSMMNLGLVVTTLALPGGFSKADPAERNTPAELIIHFMTAEDGMLDSADDLLLDVDACDPNQPDVLEAVVAPDGHQLTFGELSPVQGRATVKCSRQGTRVNMKLVGLIPGGVYTIWLLTFEEPGFTLDFAHLIGEGSLGPPDGSKNSFVASSAGKASLSVHQPAGALSEFGEATDCLFDEFEFHLVGAYHPNGQTYGPTPGPTDAPNPYCYFVEHFGFVFRAPPPPGTCGADSAPQCRGRPEGSICGTRERPGFCEGAAACGCQPSTGGDPRLCCVYEIRGGDRVFRCRTDGSCPNGGPGFHLADSVPVDSCAECHP